jgi:hypothetical protein
MSAAPCSPSFCEFQFGCGVGWGAVSSLPFLSCHGIVRIFSDFSGTFPKMPESCEAPAVPFTMCFLDDKISFFLNAFELQCYEFYIRPLLESPFPPQSSKR